VTTPAFGPPDPAQVRRHFDRAADGYEARAVVQREIRARLHERLEHFRLAPRRVLDLGSGPGAGLPDLARRFPRARLVALDLAPAMLARVPTRRRWFSRGAVSPVCADMHALPFADGSFELIVSSLALQWSADPEPVFREMARVLVPGGLALYATLGPDTLTELRAALGTDARVNDFFDMHDVGDAMIRAGLASPVLDVEHLVVEYPDARAVMRDLKGIGASHAGRPAAPGLRGRDWLAGVEARYSAFANAEGRVPATYEVVYGHGFRPEGRERPQDGSTVPGGAIAHVPVDRVSRRRG